MSKSLERGIRIDLIIALCALLVSTLTAGAAMYQGRVIADQLSASVWPYLSFNSSLSRGDKVSTYEWSMENDGAGPAIIRGALISVDGKPQTSLLEAAKTLGVSTKRARSVSASSVELGEVVRPGQQATIVRVVSKDIAAHADDIRKRMAATVCYCSVLGKCWLVRSGNEQVPFAVPDCSAYSHMKIEP